MVRASTGFRRGGRSRLKRQPRHKFTVERLVQAFKPQDKVIIEIDPSSRRGMPPLKYAGKAGVIAGSRGSAYIVTVRKGSMKKKVLAGPEHLRMV